MYGNIRQISPRAGAARCSGFLTMVEESLFPNVPNWLTNKVRGLRDTDRGRLYYRAAGWTIAWYLRKDIQARDVDDFFEPPGKLQQVGTTHYGSSM
jgi:hypothetical protein